MTQNRRKFVRTEEGVSNSIIYYDEDGNKLTQLQRLSRNHRGNSARQNQR